MKLITECADDAKSVGLAVMTLQDSFYNLFNQLSDFNKLVCELERMTAD